VRSLFSDLPNTVSGVLTPALLSSFTGWGKPYGRGSIWRKERGDKSKVRLSQVRVDSPLSSVRDDRGWMETLEEMEHGLESSEVGLSGKW
jgi:hypothetical protein